VSEHLHKLRFYRLWLGAGVVLVVLVVVMSLWPSPPKVALSHADKLVHALAYLMLMAWFGQLCGGGRDRLAWLVGLIVLGGVLELAQGLMSTRSAEWADVLANAGGAFVGWLVTLGPGGRVLAAVERRSLAKRKARSA